MQGLFPCVNSPHLSFIPVTTSRTASELLGAFTSGHRQSEHPLRTPQVTRGKGGRLTPSYFISVIQAMSHLFLKVLGGGFTDQWSHHYSFNISSGVVYYIFVLSWGFLRGGFDPTIVLQCNVELWGVPRTVQLRVSSPPLTLTFTIVPRLNPNVKSFF